MKYRHMLLTIALLLWSHASDAQVISGASSAKASAVPHVSVPYLIDGEGTKLPDIVWGLDLAWISEGNIRRGVNFAGADMIDIVRLSFQTTDPVGDDLKLSARQQSKLNERVNLAKKYAPQATINLNSDQEAGVDEWYHVYGSQNKVNTFAPRWAALIAATKKYVEDSGLKVVSVSPFNEPDYGEGQTWGWQQGSKAEMLEICRLLRQDAKYKEAFENVLLCGGNTLNNDYALPWYNYCKTYLDEGNTHQLAGSFDNFAKFFKQVVADGKTGVDDELHNTMEAMVGSEYGMTKGIWWGTCAHTRSQFMKASRGRRLGYAEHRANWTAASVYRHTDGSVQAFVGASERQATETTYRYVALDHDVFYNGVGPTREYILTIPGGTDYKENQPNAETLVNIQGGDDIMPALPTAPTKYKIINRHSGMAMSTDANNATSGAQLSQQTPVRTNKAQHWTISPVDSRSGGDFCPYIINNVQSPRLMPDVLNWTLEDGGSIVLWAGDGGDNEKWIFEYAGDGWFYIRSQHSGLYLQIQPDTPEKMKLAKRLIVQGTFTGEASQQWRLLPENTAYNAVAPGQPTELTATPQAASVALAWTAPADADLKSYTIQRSDDGGSTWHVINKDIEGNAYVDNTACESKEYQYRVRAMDKSLNLSEPSAIAKAQPTGEPSLVMYLTADADLSDATVNGNHAALFGDLTMQEGHAAQAITLDGTNNFIQLPATIANSRDLTLATWIYWEGGNSWQRIFDFGNDTDHYMFLSPKPSSSNRLRLAIKNRGSEEVLNATTTHKAKQWIHVAVTFSADAVTLYLNGEPAGSSTSIAARPADFKPVLNYVGRSQFTADPMLNAAIDDVRIYNYALSADEIAALYSFTDGIHDINSQTTNKLQPTNMLYDLGGRQISTGAHSTSNASLPQGIYILNGRKIKVK